MANNKDKIIRGEKIPFEECTKSLGEFYFEKATTNCNKVFQIEEKSGTKETYQSIKQRSTRLAINLQKLGVLPDDVIAICSENSMDNCIPHIAAAFLGAKTCGLHHSQSVRLWTHCLNLISAKYVFVEENCLENMEKCVENVSTKPKIIVFGRSSVHTTFLDLLSPCEEEEEVNFRPVGVHCRDTAVILCSSGTTGLPKAIRFSHYSLLNKCVFLSNVGTFGPDSIGLVYSTLYWISSILQIILCFQQGGSKMVIPSECDVKKMLEMIQKYKVTYIYINPTLLKPLYDIKDVEKYDLSSLRVLMTVGTAISESELKKLRNIFKHSMVLQAYGCSETLTDGTSFNPVKHKHLLHKLNSIGKATVNCDIKVIDIESGEALGPNQSGEICIKTPFLFDGYCKVDDDSYYSDGFFKTGDLGYYDEDECFYIKGRIKETFKYNKYHIPVNYLESILQEHPCVLLAGVFGVPDEDNGHLPAACVVLKENVATTVDDIEMFYNKNVSDGHRLRGGIRIVDSLPMTPTFKIQRSKLLEVFLRQ